MMEYTPVCSIHDEADVVSALINVPACRSRAFESLAEADFHDIDARRCFGMLLHIWEARRSLDDFDVQTKLLQTPVVSRVMAKCHNMPWGTALRNVLEASRRRSIQAISCRTLESAGDVTTPIEETAAEFHDALHAEDGKTSSDSHDTRDHLRALMEHVADVREGTVKVVEWGLPALSFVRRYGGTVHVVGARPSVGKTAFAVSSSLAEAQSGMPVGLICMEMLGYVITSRYVSQLSRIPALTILDGLTDVTTAQLNDYSRAADMVDSLPLHINAGRVLSVSEIRTVCVEWVRRHGVRVVYVDYAQNIRHARKLSVREGVMDSLNGIKEMAMELDIPIVLFAQLNREAHQSVPRLSHLKESGLFEEIAESVILLDRPDADGPDGNDRKYSVAAVNKEGNRYAEALSMKGRIAAIVAKQRNGEIGTRYFEYTAELMRLDPLDLHRHVAGEETYEWNA